MSDDSKEDEIGINNTVDLYFEDDEEVETYRIVTSVRGNFWQDWSASSRRLEKQYLDIKLVTAWKYRQEMTDIM